MGNYRRRMVYVTVLIASKENANQFHSVMCLEHFHSYIFMAFIDNKNSRHQLRGSDEC